MNSSFENVYRRSKGYFAPDPLPQLLYVLEKLKSPAECLDLGCGQGRDSLLMASKGHRVTAVDSSVAACDALKIRVQKTDFAITVINGGIEDLRLGSSKFDFVHARTILDHLRYESALALASRIMSSLKEDGRVVVEVFSDDDPGNRDSALPSSEMASQVRHYFKQQQLLETFGKLRFISLDRCFKYDRTHGRPHFHETLIYQGQKVKWGWKTSRLVRYV